MPPSRCSLRPRRSTSPKSNSANSSIAEPASPSVRPTKTKSTANPSTSSSATPPRSNPNSSSSSTTNPTPPHQQTNTANPRQLSPTPLWPFAICPFAISLPPPPHPRRGDLQPRSTRTPNPNQDSIISRQQLRERRSSTRDPYVTLKLSSYPARKSPLQSRYPARHS